MKYLIMMNFSYGGWKNDSIYTWPKEDVQRHMDHLNSMNQEMTDRGELVSISALQPPDEARLVTAQTGKQPLIVDGPFADTKEFLAGFWVVDVDSLDRACEIAARASAGPGPGGKPLNMTIEVRALQS